MTDRELIEKYPWLDAYDNAYLYIIGPCGDEEREQFRGIVPFDTPDGWRPMLEEMCEEVDQALKVAGWKSEDYHIAQIKEKWGGLRWYDEGGPDSLRDIIRKYEQKAMTTCCNCGKEATCYSTGYILPYCWECLPQHLKDKNLYRKLSKS